MFTVKVIGADTFWMNKTK